MTYFCPHFFNARFKAPRPVSELVNFARTIALMTHVFIPRIRLLCGFPHLRAWDRAMASAWRCFLPVCMSSRIFFPMFCFPQSKGITALPYCILVFRTDIGCVGITLWYSRWCLLSMYRTFYFHGHDTHNRIVRDISIRLVIAMRSYMYTTLYILCI